MNHIVVGRSGVLEHAVEKIKKYKDDENFCQSFLALFTNIAVENCNQVIFSNLNKSTQNSLHPFISFMLLGADSVIFGALEAMKMIAQAHPRDISMCDSVCGAIWGAVEGSYKVQSAACTVGIVSTLLDIMKIPEISDERSGSIMGSIGLLFSSEKSLTEHCTPEVLSEIEAFCRKHEDSKKARMFLMGIKREEDPRVRDAISRGVCTKDAFPKCAEGKLCDENYYCEECCVQQKVFRCLECDKDTFNFYCETCWNKAHKGHKCEEFFYPVRCVGLEEKSNK